MRLEWQDSMSVGNPILDFQHRHLLYLINGLSLALKDGNLEAAQFSIIEFLELSDLHSIEELKSISIKDPPLNTQHREAHDRMAKRMEQIRRLVCDSINPENIQIDHDQFLIDDLIGLFGFDPEFRFRLM